MTFRQMVGSNEGFRRSQTDGSFGMLVGVAPRVSAPQCACVPNDLSSARAFASLAAISASSTETFASYTSRRAA
jgi:5-enolpyruvylshikimate-3-phosphate synthase